MKSGNKKPWEAIKEWQTKEEEQEKLITNSLRKVETQIIDTWYATRFSKSLLTRIPIGIKEIKVILDHSNESPSKNMSSILKIAQERLAKHGIQEIFTEGSVSSKFHAGTSNSVKETQYLNSSAGQFYCNLINEIRNINQEIERKRAEFKQASEEMKKTTPSTSYANASDNITPPPGAAAAAQPNSVPTPSPGSPPLVIHTNNPNDDDPNYEGPHPGKFFQSKKPAAPAANTSPANYTPPPSPKGK